MAEKLLGVVGFAFKGTYSTSGSYKKQNVVTYNGSTYVALIDSPVGTPSNDGINWSIYTKGLERNDLDHLLTTDTQGLLGTKNVEVNAETLIEKVTEKLVSDETDISSLKTKTAEKNINTYYSITSQLGINSWDDITSWDVLITAMSNYSIYEIVLSNDSKNKLYANGLIPVNTIGKIKIHKHTSRACFEYIDTNCKYYVAYYNSALTPTFSGWNKLADEDISNTISDEWDNATNYDVGDLCIYDNSLWKCKTANSNQTPAENTYWTETNLADQVETLNTKMDSRVFSTYSTLTSIGIVIADEITAGSTGVDILKKLPKYCQLFLKSTSGNRSQLQSLSLLPVVSNGMLNIISNNNWVLMEFHPTSTTYSGSVYRSIVDVGITTPTITWYKYDGTVV